MANSKEVKYEEDVLWKKLVMDFFMAFIAFFLSKLYKDIDWSFPPVFLDKELNEILPKSQKGKRIADLLVKVRLKNGQSKILFIHIEIQGYLDEDFDLRMFTIYYRIFDTTKGADIVSIAVFTTEDENPSSFERNNYGTSVKFNFNLYNIHQHSEEELLASDNIFAIPILACKYALKTKPKKQVDLRLQLKLKLMRLLLERNYEPDIIRYLLMFLQSLLFLPEKQEKIYFNEIQKLTKMDELSYVTPHTRYMATWFYKTNFGYDPETQLKEKAEKLAEEKAEKLAEEKAEKLAEEKAEKLAEEKAEKLAEEKAGKTTIRYR